MGRTLLRAVGFLLILSWAALLARGEASWKSQPYSLAIPTHISALGQTIEGFVELILQHDAPCTLAVSVSGAGNEVLTLNSATLTTSYQLTGACLQNPDTTWATSTHFLTHTYNVTGTGPPYAIILWAQGIAPSDQAPDAGIYSAAIVLTASW